MDNATALVTRVRHLEAELIAERRRRVLAEQKSAGLRSAIARLQAMMAAQRKAAAKPDGEARKAA
jgi:hypothetical protein